MNLANKLTVSRVLVIPFFVVALLPGSFGLPESVEPWFRLVALAIFVYAAISDYWDGALARKHGWITNFGKLFDPLADKLIVMAALVGMVELGLFPAWTVILILCREFLITGLRTLAVEKGRVLAADGWGKLKTVLQMTTIITTLVFLSVKDLLEALRVLEPATLELAWGWAWLLLQALMLLSVLLTTLSGLQYTRKNWDLIREDFG